MTPSRTLRPDGKRKPLAGVDPSAGSANDAALVGAMTTFDYTQSQRQALAVAIQKLPRVLDERPGLDPWISFLYVADEIRSALRRIGPDSRVKYAANVRAGRHVTYLATELLDLFKSESNEAYALQEVWASLEIPIPWSQATETLAWIKKFILIAAPPEQGAFVGASKTKLIREYYYWLLGAWSALGGRFTFTRNPDSTIDGPLVRYLRTAADPVLEEHALKPSSLKHVISAAKKLKPISPVRTRARNKRSGNLWRGYNGGPVIVTYVHMRGQLKFSRREAK